MERMRKSILVAGCQESWSGSAAGAVPWGGAASDDEDMSLKWPASYFVPTAEGDGNLARCYRIVALALRASLLLGVRPRFDPVTPGPDSFSIR